MIGEKKGVASSIFWFSFRTMINVLLILVLVEGYTTTYNFSYKLFADHPYIAASSETMNVTIESGDNVNRVAVVLDEMGIVDSKYLFIARAYLGKYHDRIQPGTYVLGPGMSPEEICKKICGVQSEDIS